ncbi:endo-1,4-beta-xylanase C precursor [Lentinula edodes]|uniref:endo-1,4-beta-xylanase C precursor n=1 Tax=Lentinula edodes TaxID=5353 RepID=UPI001E8CC21F|nr:endo-1,4-beta-xylanase C precursor [Lentinula edodes]KAH7873576.1 endo-1,4-beta-xylanase C precursor [Lentinula edodes]
MKLSATILALAIYVSLATAQSQEWGQCGGIGWAGSTTCVSGTVCTVINAYYSQCLPARPSSECTGPTSTASIPPAPTGSNSNALARAAGKLYFGTATDNSELSDAAYVAILSDDSYFGQLTPANSMKWDATEPEQGVFTFSGGDQIVSQAKAHSQIMRGHNCVWYNQLPSWVSNGGFTSAQLTSIIQNHCSTLVSHYKGEIITHAFETEPFNDDGTWRSDVFYNTLGTSYVDIALQAARAADPGAKIYINDYNIEMTGAKATSMLNLIKDLKSRGIPVDGVGLQCHFIVGEVPTSLQSIMQQFTALGVEVAITELDIRMTLPASTALLAQQETDYKNVISACKAVSGCVGVTVWDYTDKYSWVPSTFSGQGEACPWDANLQKKPAYSGITAAWA